MCKFRMLNQFPRTNYPSLELLYDIANYGLFALIKRRCKLIRSVIGVLFFAFDQHYLHGIVNET